MNYVRALTDLQTNPLRTMLDFNGGENGRWVVELYTDKIENGVPKRVKIQFSGVARVRVSDPADYKSERLSLLTEIEQSEWVKKSLDDYVAEFGTAQLGFVNDVRHFIVHGYDMSIGILAQKWTLE